jgi:hypothetical protein
LILVKMEFMLRGDLCREHIGFYFSVFSWCAMYSGAWVRFRNGQTSAPRMCVLLGYHAIRTSRASLRPVPV